MRSFLMNIFYMYIQQESVSCENLKDLSPESETHLLLCSNKSSEAVN